MTQNKIFLSFILFFLSMTAMPASMASPASDLSDVLNTVHTLEADFDQTIYDNRGKVIQKSYGQMALSRPGKFRWQIIKPIPQLIIANQARIWIYDPDLQQVTVRSLKHTTGETPALLLSHVNTVLDKDFSIKELEKTSSEKKWFKLLPRKNESFASIEMAFKQNQITDMKLQDHLGHTTHIRFKNAKLNIPLAASVFIFKPPAKVDVIHEREE